jgi:UDP-glucose 4-epimerase/UDP-arabinose 4-epimerase
MHFRACSQFGESVGDPQKYYLNNVGGTLSLLKAMLGQRCRRLVFSSTGAVYGNAGRDPISESAAGTVVNAYGASKWMIEQILADYRRAYGMNSFCLRYFNACGAEASGSIGEFRDPETHLIPRAMMTLRGMSATSRFSGDYETPDGTAIRDYIHVLLIWPQRMFRRQYSCWTAARRLRQSGTGSDSGAPGAGGHRARNGS